MGCAVYLAVCKKIQQNPRPGVYHCLLGAKSGLRNVSQCGSFPQISSLLAQAGPQWISPLGFAGLGVGGRKPTSHGRGVEVTMATQRAPACLQSVPAPLLLRSHPQTCRVHLRPGALEEHTADAEQVQVTGSFLDLLHQLYKGH